MRGSVNLYLAWPSRNDRYQHDIDEHANSIGQRKQNENNPREDKTDPQILGNPGANAARTRCRLARVRRLLAS